MAESGDGADGRASDDGTAGASAAAGDGSVPGSPRLLLLLGDRENRQLMIEWAREAGYGTRVADPRDPGDPDDGRFDLCVLDVEGARRAGEFLAAVRRRRHPTFVPALLLVPARGGDGGGASTAAIEGVDVTVDDVLTTPVRKRQLRRRVDTLLRARGLSVELEERKEQYRRLLGLTPEAIFLLCDGEVAFLNEVGRELLAGTADDGPDVDGTAAAARFEGRPFLEFVAEDDRERARTLLASLAEGSPPEEYADLSLVDRGGTRVETEVTGVRVPYEGELATQLVVRDVTDRKRRERRLRLYGRALEEASVGITIGDVSQPDDPLVYANESFERITGYDAPEVLGRNCRFLQGEDTDPDTVAEIGAALDAEESWRGRIRNYRADGTPFWNELELTPVPAPDGEVTHYLGFQRDVTDRVERERQLESLHATARELMSAETKAAIAELAVDAAEDTLELPGVAVFLYDDIEGGLRPVAAADATRELFGELPVFRPGEGIAWSVYEDGEARLVEDVREDPEVYDPDTPARTELLVPLGEHGVFVAGSTEVGGFDDADERFARLLALNVVAALDRADREQQLRERTAELETRVRQGEVVADLGRRAIRTAELDSLFEAAVDAVAETLGTDYAKVLEYRPDREDLLLRAGVGWGEGLVGSATVPAGRDSQAGFTLVSEAPVVVEDLATEDRFSGPELLVDHEVTSGISVVIGSTEDPWGVLGAHATDRREFGPEDADFVRSVANLLATAIDRVRRDRELARFETVVRAAGEGIYTLDPEGRFVAVNEAFVELTGHDRDELIGEHVSTVLAEGDVDRAEARIADLLAGEGDDTTVEVTIERADGERREALANIALLPAEGEFRGTVGVVRDVTEQRRRLQRMEVMDRVLRHNLRNEMNVVRGRAELLADAVEGPASDHVEEILRSADALLSLSEGARRFHEAFHGEAGDPVGPVEVADLVEGVADRLRERFPEATVDCDVTGPALARGHRALRIAVEELVENAVVHADREDPTVSVTVRPDGEWVELVVADDGPGLPPAERATFEGEAESALDHASGLGLWLVNWIVDSSDGEVTADPADPRGTVVRIRLRRTDAGPAADRGDDRPADRGDDPNGR